MKQVIAIFYHVQAPEANSGNLRVISDCTCSGEEPLVFPSLERAQFIASSALTDEMMRIVKSPYGQLIVTSIVRMLEKDYLDMMTGKELHTYSA